MKKLVKGQKVDISVKELFNHYGENTPSCSIEHSTEGKTEYFDLYQNYSFCACDGEEVEFIELNDIGEYWFINKEGEKNKEFYFTKEELNICMFTESEDKEMRTTRIEDVKIGDVIKCYDEYNHDYEEHDFLVYSIENDEENGISLYGEDLTYDDDENRIGVVTVANFIEINKNKTAYEKYKKEWVKAHISENEQNKVFSDYLCYFAEDDVEEDYTFDNYLEDFGYNGELYVCYDEWLANEYAESEE